MKKQKRLRGYGITIGTLPTGKKNSITDVPGVKVGHVTLDDGKIKTGVTAIIPHEGDLFHEKLLAASHVINGFGKSVGTIQINELGTIEAPILLTNTLSVGTVLDAAVDYMLENNEDIGNTTGTVNAVVCECNDGEFLNDIRGKHVKKEHVFEAIENAGTKFEEGGVGAGTGMSCCKLKGGIGTASRQVSVKEKNYNVGVLVLSNHGEKQDLLIDGKQAGKAICDIDKHNLLEGDKGSIITIIATDLPLTSRQLKRVAKRAVMGIARTGSHMGHWSGEVVIAFSTANIIPHYEEDSLIEIKMLNPAKIDEIIFRAVVESTEEAILNSLVTAKTTIGKNGNIRKGLTEYFEFESVKKLLNFN
jgi:D-aminopeptidase